MLLLMFLNFLLVIWMISWHEVESDDMMQQMMRNNIDNQWDQMFYQDVSTSTFFTVKNISTDYKFDYNLTMALEKKLAANTSNPYSGRRSLTDEFKRSEPLRFPIPQPPPNAGQQDARKYYYNTNFLYEIYVYLYGCRMVTNTYRNAFLTFREYFYMRTIYVDNLEYEVGYITYNIVHKYQSVLEVYGLIHRKYVMANNTEKAPLMYMFYLYRVIAESCKVIIHLCNMMHEMKRKYNKHETIFTVFKLQDREKIRRKRLKKRNKAGSYSKVLDKVRKQRKKDLAEGLDKHAQGSTISRFTKTWPLEYGWSIEDWWMWENSLKRPKEVKKKTAAPKG